MRAFERVGDDDRDVLAVVVDLCRPATAGMATTLAARRSGLGGQAAAALSGVRIASTPGTAWAAREVKAGDRAAG